MVVAGVPPRVEGRVVKGSSKRKIDTSGASGAFAHQAFAGLKADGLAQNRCEEAESPAVVNPEGVKKIKGPRPVVSMRRLTAGKGGKTVTELSGFEPGFFSGGAARELLKHWQRAAGVGGALKDDCLEFQGDVRERMEPWLNERGYRVVRSGG